MKMSKHTKGPWEVHGDAIMAEPNSHIEDTALGIAYVMDHDSERPASVTRANARLIAAAPDLLDALIAVVAISDRKHDAWDAAKAAIAKATGEQL